LKVEFLYINKQTAKETMLRLHGDAFIAAVTESKVSELKLVIGPPLNSKDFAEALNANTVLTKLDLSRELQRAKGITGDDDDVKKSVYKVLATHTTLTYLDLGCKLD
jgi:hypothetical protein